MTICFQDTIKHIIIVYCNVFSRSIVLETYEMSFTMHAPAEGGKIRATFKTKNISFVQTLIIFNTILFYL